MKEKIGMYTRNQIFNYMSDQEGSMLGRSMYDAIFEELDKYKAKEDKIKKVIEDNLFIAYEEEESKINICYFEELQQILNEGDK